MFDVLNRSAGACEFRHRAIVDGVMLTISYAVDVEEHGRRSAEGTGAVVDEFLLAGLLSLPRDDMASVDDRFSRLLISEAPQSTVALIKDPLGGWWGRRVLGCPVEVIELETENVSWRCGLELVQRWVGYGPRVVHVVQEMTPLELTEASHYGIGVVRDGQRLLEPGEFRPQRWSSARWRFAELVYEQYLVLSA